MKQQTVSEILQNLRSQIKIMTNDGKLMVKYDTSPNKYRTSNQHNQNITSDADSIGKSDRYIMVSMQEISVRAPASWTFLRWSMAILVLQRQSWVC